MGNPGLPRAGVAQVGFALMHSGSPTQHRVTLFCCVVLSLVAWAAACAEVESENAPLLPEDSGSAFRQAADLASQPPQSALPAVGSSGAKETRDSPPAPGYATVLSGTLQSDLQLGPENSPVLIRGHFTVPEHLSLRIKPGVVIHLQADAQAPKPAHPGSLDPSRHAAIWVLGALIAEGHTGNPVEIANLEKPAAALLFYGARHSRLEGLRVKGASVTQTGGACLWTNCEFQGLDHYALAGGAALFTHCTFRECGPVFATYNSGTWSLLARKNLFERCREGLVLGSDPGPARLAIEYNNFSGTRGAHIRAAGAAGAGKAHSVPGRERQNSADLEVLIGENWYGNAPPEELERKLVDRRSDPGAALRLNTRPPAEQAYREVGAGVSLSVLAATVQKQQFAVERILKAHPEKSAAQDAATAMGKTEPRRK